MEERKQALRFFSNHLLPYLVIIFLICLGLDFGMRRYVIFKTPIHGASKIKRVVEGTREEIAIFGSSRALGSYIPDSLASSAYNYGINGIGYEVIDILLKYETVRMDNSSPIIINFDYNMFRAEIGDLNNYIPHLNRPGFRKLLQDRNAWKVWYRLPGIRFFNSYDSYFKDYINAKVGLTKVVSKGASLEKNVIPEATFLKLVERRLKHPAEWKVDSIQEARLITHFDTRPDRKFYLVIAPYHWSYYQGFKGMDAAQAWLDEIDRRKNVDVIKVAGRDWPDSLFVNTTHINLKGAQKFTAIVRLALEKRNQFHPKDVHPSSP